MKKYFPIFIIISLVIAVQLWVTAADKTFYLTQLTMSAYYTIVVIGLCMLMGYAGQISIGHAGFFAIGGYGCAALSSADFMTFSHTVSGKILIKAGCLYYAKDLYGSEIAKLHPWICFIMAILATIIIAYIIGVPALRLKGHYLAMATLGFGSIIYKIVLGTRVFGAADGLSGIEPFTIAPWLKICGSMEMRIQNYYFAWLLVVLAALFMQNLIHSRSGRALRAIHGNEDAAEAMGIDTARYKLNLFMISAVFASVAGIFLMYFNGGIGPSEASVTKSIRYVAIVAVGGMANLWGTVLAGAGLNFLSLRGYFGSYDEAVFGIILVLAMLFAPNGIMFKTGFKFKSKSSETNDPS